MQADDAQYHEGDGALVVQKPHVTFYMDDGKRRAELTGEEGRLTLEGKELSAVTITGDVVLLLDDLEIRTDTAHYDHEEDRIKAPGVVTIHSKTLDVRGLGMEVEVTPQVMRLLGEVHTVLRNDAKKS
jgi:LPS export ABC transporter protein LptC